MWKDLFYSLWEGQGKAKEKLRTLILKSMDVCLLLSHASADNNDTGFTEYSSFTRGAGMLLITLHHWLNLLMCCQL